MRDRLGDTLGGVELWRVLFCQRAKALIYDAMQFRYQALRTAVRVICG